MAKTYEEFKKTHIALDAKLKALRDTVKSNTTITSMQKELSVQAAKAIGARVRKLRESGAEGDSIGDFGNDSEVAKSVTFLKTAQATYNTALTSTQTAMNTAAPLIKEKTALETALATEIAARKKEVIKSKSLPDMEKLLTTVKAIDVNSLKGALKPYDLFCDVDDEINKSKDVAAKEEEAELEEQRLNERILAGKRGTVAARLTTVNTAVAETLKAQRANNGKDALTHKQAAEKALAESKAIADEYTGLQTKWRKDYMTTKAGPKIDAVITEIKSLHTKAAAAFATIPRDWKPALPPKK